MREMKDSGLGWIGAIPSGWDVVPQKHLMYKTKSICEHWNNEPILSLTTGGVIVRDIESGKGKFPASFDGYQNLEPGNLLLCLFDMDVTPRCVGLVRVAGVTSPAYSQFAMKPAANARFYDYYLRAMDDQKLYVPLTSTLRHSFTEETFGQIPAVMPPLDEQRRIADYLDERCADIDAAVDAAEKSVDEYKTYQQSVIYEAVTGKDLGTTKRDSGLGWIGSIPSEWHVVPQKHLMYKTKSLCEHWDCEPILSLTTSGVIVRDIASGKGKFPASFDGYQYLEPGNLLLCLFDMDVTPRCVGLIGVAGITSPAYSQFVMKSGASARFYDYYLRAMDDRKLYVPLTSTLRHSFTEETFGQIPAVMPPFDEQQRIATYLDAKCAEIQRAVTAKQSIIADLKAYKQSLIYEAVTGKREVQ
jgi:type I restriction enzyme S subunit